MNPFSFLLACIRLVLIVLLMLVMLTSYSLLTVFFIFHTQKRAFALRRIFVNICSPLMGISIEKEGQVGPDAALYVCNHRSFSDPVIVCKYVNAYVIAKAEVADLPILNQGAKLTGVIYVKRESSDSRKNTRKLLIETLLSNKNVLVYPEGTTNGNKTVKPYKPGAIIETAKRGIPIVPIVVEYKNKESLWVNRGMAAQLFLQLSQWKTYAKISIGQPRRGDDGLAIKEEIEAWTNAKIHDMHEGWDSVFS